MSIKKEMNKKWIATMNSELLHNDAYVHCTVAGKRRVGHVIGYNYYTTWVRIKTGAKKYFVTCRHNKKHNVKFFKSEEEPIWY